MKKRLIFLIIIILFPLNIKAESLELSLSCPKQTTSNKVINCLLSTNEQTIKGIKLNFQLPTNITYKSIKPASNWNIYYENSNGLVLTNLNNTSNNVSTISFNIDKNIELDKEYNIILNNIEISDINNNYEAIPNITSTINVLSNETTLSSLTISSGNLSPAFNKNTYNYTATTSDPTIEILATPTNKNTKVTGSIGKNQLNYGTNIFNIVVTSPLNNTSTYKITIIRPISITSSKENNNNQENKNSNSTSQHNYNTNNGNNESNSISLSSDASLKSITIDNYNLNFSPNTYLYKLNVKNNITKLNITAIPNNKNAKVEIEQKNLEVGKNYITITVTAQDNTICKYTIEVTRERQKSTTKKNNTIKESTNTQKNKTSILNIPKTIIIAIILIAIIILTLIIKKITKFQKEDKK
jgi:hypothetical protein